MKRQYFVVLFLLSLFSSCKDSEQVTLDYPEYTLTVEIVPEERFIDVEGTIIMSPGDLSNTASFFYLERNLEIHSFTINGEEAGIPDTAVSDNRFMPLARKVYIDSTVEINKDQPVEIGFSYSGYPDELPEFFANRIGADWTEMGLYYPWFPYNPDIARTFSYELTIETPSENRVFGIGRIKKEEGKTTIKSMGPATDIVLCMSPDTEFYQAKAGDHDLNIFHHGFNDSLLTEMSSDIEKIMNIYDDWFGKIESGITIIETKRESGGGYARIGGVVLGDIYADQYFSRKEAYYRYFAHELAHLWWFMANTTSWEDWLNESFAEYSAHLVIREVFGQESYDSRIKEKIESSESTPPIWGFNRNTAEYSLAYEVIYNKGTVLLSELESRIGKEGFIELCSTMAEKNIKTTEGFLDILAYGYGEDKASWFEGMLKNR